MVYGTHEWLPVNRTRGRSPSVLYRKSRVCHVNHKRYDIVQMACMMLPYMGICKPTGPCLANEILVRAHPGEKARLSASSSGKQVGLMVDRGSLVIVEQTLLRGIDPTKRVPRRFDLGMSDFVGSDACQDENRDPSPRKLSLSLKRPKEPSSSESLKAKRPRKALQASNDITEADYDRMAVPFVPANTKKNNDWARKNFIAWRDARNAANPNNKCPEDLLYKVPFDIDALVYWLPRYVCETRTKAGKKYPASTILCLLWGLLREMRSVSPDCPNFMDTSDSRFKGMHSIVDSYFRQLRSEGVGAAVRHASLINKDEENLLWQQGVLGDDTPERLLRAVFYYNGKNICLRGGKEHRCLKISQFVRSYDPDMYTYTENGSKNRSGGLYECRVENKCVVLMATPNAGNRCHVRLLDKYLAKLHPKARELDCFYMQPLTSSVVSDPTKIWFSAQPCGENKLSSMVKNMFKMVGIEGKTNHSLRASGATEMFKAGVPEKIIQERTGHRSVKALRTYERTTAMQHLSVANVLSSSSNVSFSDAKMNLSQ